MESVDVFLSIAEVAIALAGFGGIAAGIGYRARGEWSSADRVRLIGMASTSLVVVFACFVPSVLFHLGVGAPWRLAATILLPFPVLGVALQMWLNHHSVDDDYSLLSAVFIATLHALSITLLAIVAAGYGDSREAGLYLCTIAFALAQASLLFVRLLVTSFSQQDR